MTATIFLIRHAAHGDIGQILSGRLPGGLSDMGRQQAALLANHLRVHRLAAIHTSPVQRARETGECIAEGRDVHLEEVAALGEIDFGVWTGRSFTMLENDVAWHKWNDDRAGARAPAGETMAEAQRRIVEHIEWTAATYSGSTIALVTHGDMIRGAIAHYLELGLNQMLNFDIDPASLSRLVVGRWGGRIQSLNERTH